MSERWMEIPGAAGYEVSDLGRVRSWWTPRAKVPTRLSAPAILKARANREGYMELSVRYGTRRRARLVHRLVLEAFVGPCPAGHQARHYPDRAPSNNALDNLSWATPEINCADRVEHGTYKNGMAGRKRAHSPETRAKISATLRSKRHADCDCSACLPPTY